MLVSACEQVPHVIMLYISTEFHRGNSRCFDNLITYFAVIQILWLVLTTQESSVILE